MSRIREYIDRIRRTRDGLAPLEELFIWLFRDVDARLAGVEGTSTSVAELERTLLAYGRDLVDQTVNPLRDQILAAADLGTVFTAHSVSPVPVAAGLAAFVVPEDERAAFAPPAMLAIAAADDPAVALFARKLAWDKASGVLDVEVLAAHGTGTKSSWTITAGAMVPVAALIATDPVGAITATTLQGAIAEIDALVAARAPSASPVLTGTPAAPTPAAGDNSTRIATTAFVKTALDALVGAAPGALDTLAELAAALAGDAAFASTVTTALGNRYTKAEADAKIAAAAATALADDDALVDGHFRLMTRGNPVGSLYILIPGGSWWASSRWKVESGGNTAWRQGQLAIHPTDPTRHVLRYAFTTSGDADQYDYVRQRIEGAGTFAGMAAALACEARVTSGTGAIALQVVRNFGVGGSSPVVLKTQVFPLTTAWSTPVLALTAAEMAGLAGKTLGPGDHLEVRVWLAAGSNHSAAAGGLSVGVQEVELTALRFRPGAGTPHAVPRALADEATRAARYWQVLGRGVPISVWDSSTVRAAVVLPVRMRAVPVVTYVGASLGASIGSTYKVASSPLVGIVDASPTGAAVNLSGFSGLTAGQAGALTTSDTIAFDAEL